VSGRLNVVVKGVCKTKRGSCRFLKKSTFDWLGTIPVRIYLARDYSSNNFVRKPEMHPFLVVERNLRGDNKFTFMYQKSCVFNTIVS
jgi:hypothetical protein